MKNNGLLGKTRKVKYKYYSQHAENKRWIKKITYRGRLSILKWFNRGIWHPRRTVEKYLRDRMYSDSEIDSLKFEAIVWAHLQPNKKCRPLKYMIGWRYDRILRGELQRVISIEQNEISFTKLGRELEVSDARY
jgi:hypothetical protein